MRRLTYSRIPGRSIRNSMRSAVTAATLVGLALTGSVIGGNSVASASLVPHVSAAPCNVTITKGTGQVVGSYILGVTAGSTVINFDCNASSGAGVAAEASLLAGVGAKGVTQASEADISAIGQFTQSATDTGCPTGTAGSCVSATFPVPANFSAADHAATCPPTPAAVNSGLFGCAIAIATTQLQPLAGAEYLVTYANQPATPNSPTVVPTVTAGPPSSTITVSDAAANTGFWWANGISLSQTTSLGLAPVAAPASCGSGAGYGNVPSPFLAVNWFAAGSSSAIAGSAAGVSISDTCFDGTTLYAPTLSGTIPVPSTLTNGTSYTVYLCEANLTPFASNDPNASTDCGTPLPGTFGWIDASFSFSAAAGTPQAALSVTSTSGTLGTPLTLASSGGSGSGAVSFAVVNGTATGCAVTGGALSASSAGTCVVTASKASDSTYLAVNSTPTTVTLAPLPVESLVTTKVKLARTAKTLGVKISCAGAACAGTLSASVHVVLHVRKAGEKPSVTYNFGPAGYSVAAGATSTVTLHLTRSFEKFLEGNPDRPVLQASITVTDNLGKKKVTLGRVSLLK